MDASAVIGSAGSGRREIVLAGGGALALGLLFVLWRSRRASSSLAEDTGAAGYTYPMPGGSLNTAPADNTALTSLFTQNQEILRLLAPSGTDVGAPTGTPDAPRPGPVPTVGAVPRYVPTDQPTTTTAGIPYVQPTFQSNTVGQIGHDYALSPDATQEQRTAALNSWLTAVSTDPANQPAAA